MKKYYFFLVFFFITQNIKSQSNWELLVGGISGISNLKTSYDDFSPIGYSSDNREFLLSNPKLMLGVFGECAYSVNNILGLKSNVFLIENGYQYKLYNSSDQSSIKAKYKRLDFGLEVGVKLFVFAKKTKTKRKKKDAISPYFNLAYNFRIKLKDSYQFADQTLIPEPDSENNNSLSSYNIGFGLKRGKIELLAFFNYSISDFIKDQGSNEIHLNNFGLKTAYRFLD